MGKIVAMQPLQYIIILIVNDNDVISQKNKNPLGFFSKSVGCMSMIVHGYI